MENFITQRIAEVAMFAGVTADLHWRVVLQRTARLVGVWSYLSSHRWHRQHGGDRNRQQIKRQREAIAGFAKRAGFVLVGECYDAAVSGADPIEARPGFAELLNRIEDNGVRIVIVEDASRFARELVTQELGILALIKRGMRVLTANGDDLTDSSDPSRKMMRQIAGSFHEYEKARVAKLKAARDRKRAIGTKVEGRKSHAELNPEMVALARQLRRKRPKGGQRSLREISRELAATGYLNEQGRAFAPNSIRNMLARPRPARSSDDGEEEATR